MKSTFLCRSSLLALSLAAVLAPSGCIAPSSDSEGAGGGEPEQVGAAAQALQVSGLAYTLVNIANEWHCPSDSSCGMTLSWGGSSPPTAELVAASDTSNLVPWLLLPVPGTTDQFYIYNEWHCAQGDSRCEMDLAFSGTTVDLYPTNDTVDQNPWKFVPVPGTTDQFYVYNEWRCAQGDSRCGMGLSWTGTGTAVLSSDPSELVPWKVTIVNSARSALFDDSCDKPTYAFSSFTETVTPTNGGSIDHVWAGIGSWSQSSVYTVTLTSGAQTQTYTNLGFSPRSQQGYNPCVPKDNMAGAALPYPFFMQAGQPVTISISGSSGEMHRDASGHVRMTLEGSDGVSMAYYGGKIMTTAVTKNIFWGQSWATYSGDKITGLDSFYEGFSGSNYAKTSDEYTGTNGQVGSTTTHQGHVIDSATTAKSDYTSILAEVCAMITSPDPSGNGYYAVYTDLPRGSDTACAWHSSGTCSGVPLQFAFFYDVDGDAGCERQDSVTGHSQGLAALAHMSAHELSEARTDPNGDAWSTSGNWKGENGDKCAWTFNVPYVTFSNGSQWRIQGEWSNVAYAAGTGYPNKLGQHGCLDGH